MRRLSAIIGMIFSLAGFATAQIPTKGNIFLGYSYNSVDFNGSRGNMNGWDGSLEGKVAPWVGIVADISSHYGSDATLHDVLFGPRVSVPVGKFTPFAHALFGYSHIGSDGGPSDTSFGDALGGGIDYRLVHGIGWRFQLDALQTRFFSEKQNDFRFSTGIVFHF